MSQDYLLPLGLNTNHGFAKVPVENSEVLRQRTYLQQRLTRLKQWAQSAGKREAQASRRRERLRKDYKSRSDDLYRELGLYQTALELQGMADYILRRQFKESQAVIEAELELIRVKEWRAYEQCNNEFRKQERYCKEQRDVLRALEDLEAKERTMYELDHVNGSIRLRLDFPMDACSLSPSVPPVAFFQRRNITKYRDSLFILG